MAESRRATVAALALGVVIGAASTWASTHSGRPAPVVIPYPVRAPGPVLADGERVTSRAAAVPNGIRVYYDAVHGARHLWNRDNRRSRTDYHTISGWFRFLEALRQAGYEVHAERYASFDRQALDPYDVFVVGEQTYHGRFMTDDERADLLDWVRDGGGLFVTAEHTNAHYMGDNVNRLLADLPVKARFDSICDSVTADPSAVDWVRLPRVVAHPITRGVDEYYFFNGCSLDTAHGVLLSHAEAWSDRYDPSDKPVHNGNKKQDEGETTGPLAGVAAFEVGRGRIVVVGDHNGLSNTEIYQGDHHRFALNAIAWLAHAEDRSELVAWDYPTGVDLLVHVGAGSELALHRKADDMSFKSVYGFLSKEPQLRPWASEEMAPGREVLLLGAPTGTYTSADLATIDGYLSAGRSVIWLATSRSIESTAGRTLMERYGFQLEVGAPALKTTRPLEVVGPEEWTADIFRVFAGPRTPRIHVDGLEPIVQLRRGAWHVEEELSDTPLVDLISRRDVGGGAFYVIAPFEIFDDENLPDLYGESSDVIRQQMAELVLRLVKIAADDHTVLVD
jgi:hypothetical protein